MEWLDQYQTIQKTRYDLYELIIRLHIIPELGHIALRDLTTRDIQNLLHRKQKEERKDGKPGGLSSRTIQPIYTVLLQALNKAVRLAMIPRNPAVEAERPPVRRKPIEPLE